MIQPDTTERPSFLPSYWRQMFFTILPTVPVVNSNQGEGEPRYVLYGSVFGLKPLPRNRGYFSEGMNREQILE